MADRLLYYDHRKKQEIYAVFFVWQSIVHSMICMSCQPGQKNDLNAVL